MNTFTWLLLGHLVGDWMFQSDWMAQGKLDGPFARATLVHCATYTVITAIFLAFAGTVRLIPFLLVALGLYLSHWLIDGLDMAGRWMQIMQQGNLRFVRIMVDQTMHALVLALLAVLVAPSA